MVADRNLLYEQELKKHIRKTTRLLDAQTMKKNWLETDYLLMERVLQMHVEALIGFSRYYLEVAHDIAVAKSRDAIDELKELSVLTKSEHDEAVKIIGFRNVIVHDYLNINPDIIEAIVTNKLYKVVNQLFAKLSKNLSKK